jgi:NitT/TauT family transport system permease protein
MRFAKAESGDHARVLQVLRHIWGGDRSEPSDAPRYGLIDVVVVAGLAGLFLALLQVARQWKGELHPSVEIDLSLGALPRYTLFSLSRGLCAYVISLTFTLGYGYWAAKDKRAERILIPLLDILQSIPVLGFMPGLVLALVALFPTRNFGLELAAVLMIFTGQAWNMTFSYYHSLKSVPGPLNEVASLYRFGSWRRLRNVELPFAATGLVWNSMMSMAGGWFFLMINEAFVLGDKDFRLPGLGAYMSVAVARGNVPAMLSAMAAMTAMIILVDQILWRPLVVWARKFRIEEGGAPETGSSWMLELLRHSKLLGVLGDLLGRARSTVAGQVERRQAQAKAPARATSSASWVPLAVLLLLLALGAVRLVRLVRIVPMGDWIGSLGMSALTLSRVLTAIALGTLWALPAGLWIGLSPRLTRLLQPVVQVLASFPAPMLFPLAIAVLARLGVSLGWGSIVLMLLGTQWYILFNVLAGARSIPGDLREAARSYRLTPAQTFWHVHLPAVFPYLVTGWVTAAGGAWNASIVAEYVTFHGEVVTTRGLGSQISVAAEKAQLPLLATSVTIMAIVVVTFNRTVWRALYRYSERRFSLA